jgi:hypothetical protein
MIGPKAPDHIFLAIQGGFVFYPEKQVAGFQFVDADDKQYFVPLPGQVVAGIPEHVQKLLEAHPEIPNCNPPYIQTKKLH